MHRVASSRQGLIGCERFTRLHLQRVGLEHRPVRGVGPRGVHHQQLLREPVQGRRQLDLVLQFCDQALPAGAKFA